MHAVSYGYYESVFCFPSLFNTIGFQRIIYPHLLSEIRSRARARNREITYAWHRRSDFDSASEPASTVYMASSATPFWPNFISAGTMNSDSVLGQVPAGRMITDLIYMLSQLESSFNPCIFRVHYAKILDVRLLTPVAVFSPPWPLLDSSETRLAGD